VVFVWASRSLAHASGSKDITFSAVSLCSIVLCILLATRRGRRFAATRVLKALRSASASLRRVAASPVKLALLVGGSAMVTLAYIGGLAASVQAFGGGVGFAEIGAVYMAASAIAAVSPTPGGLGAIEAALVAGLTGVGLSPGAAVSSVLTYRLATYWLPVVPGWISLSFLQRGSYV
jgi:undecaprenyl-diphosphatase